MAKKTKSQSRSRHFSQHTCYSWLLVTPLGRSIDVEPGGKRHDGIFLSLLTATLFSRNGSPSIWTCDQQGKSLVGDVLNLRHHLKVPHQYLSVTTWCIYREISCFCAVSNGVRRLQRSVFLLNQPNLPVLAAASVSSQVEMLSLHKQVQKFISSLFLSHRILFIPSPQT